MRNKRLVGASNLNQTIVRVRFMVSWCEKSKIIQSQKSGAEIKINNYENFINFSFSPSRVPLAKRP